uniref:Putative AMP-dependent synthetase and ligase n=1 Tax=Magnetococcus massalia (strain MO-1) TaxID=451514 RepID=A0A1S7LCL1_MAGMO|nr:putative AMP-dependent synthetase and ligase [Candidatus Magnetococcus massalia]
MARADDAMMVTDRLMPSFFAPRPRLQGSRPLSAGQGGLFLLRNSTQVGVARLIGLLPEKTSWLRMVRDGLEPPTPPAEIPIMDLQAMAASRWQGVAQAVKQGRKLLLVIGEECGERAGRDRLPPELLTLTQQLHCPIQFIQGIEDPQGAPHFWLERPWQPEESLKEHPQGWHSNLLHRLRSSFVSASLELGPQHIWQAALGSLKHHAPNPISDSTGLVRTPKELLLQSRVLAHLLSQQTEPGESVGLLLPSSVGGMMLFLGLIVEGRIPALLNFSAGAHGMRSACRTASVGRVITSRRFIERAGLQDAVKHIQRDRPVLYLEDLKQRLGLGSKLAGVGKFLKQDRLGGGLPPTGFSADDPAVTLFTSGSEGQAKGVVLSHRNLLANIHQIRSAVTLHRHDRYLNTLPMFHAFGLTVGTLVPLIEGFSLHQHPSPLTHHTICHLGRSWRPTIMAGTDTFLHNYARSAEEGDFSTIRFLFAGAEPLRPRTTELWREKFGVPVYQGYGTTECAPALSCNTPGANKPESVGRLFGGIESRLIPVEGLEEGGRLQVKGPNVMRGYLMPDTPGHPARCQFPRSADGEVGWYDTGDIVTLDEAGFIIIDGRAKRFAKIGGEMVSLALVERLAEQLWPDHQHAAVRLPSPSKGERIWLYSSHSQAHKSDLISAANARGKSTLLVPERILFIDALPLLGNGKTDHQALQRLAEKALNPPSTS